jgi:hypothetical protein
MRNITPSLNQCDLYGFHACIWGCLMNHPKTAIAGCGSRSSGIAPYDSGCVTTSEACMPPGGAGTLGGSDGFDDHF